jgi:mono/diheme cytochrome c family protein
MSALRILRPAVLLVMVLGAAACSGGSGDAGSAAAPPPADLGARLYTQNCLPCHHDDGAGVPTVYPSLANSAVVNGDPTELAQWVLSGKRPKSMPAGRYSTQMLLFGWMKDPEAAALLTYIRGSFGNQAPPMQASDIAKARP